jgi:hypothetical protein
LRTFSKAVPIPYQYPNRPPKTRQETTSVNKKTLNPEEIIVARQCIEEQTPENQATSDDTFGEQTPKAIEKNICEIMKTLAKTPFITEPLNTVVVINKEVIISPILTPPETQISKDTREAIAYYRRLVTDKRVLLNDVLNNCNQVLLTPTIDEDNQGDFMNFMKLKKIKGDIRCACELAKLLINNSLAQFSELIDKIVKRQRLKTTNLIVKWCINRNCINVTIRCIYIPL